MALSVINTKNAPAALGPYSQAIGAGQFLFVSGQLGIIPQTGELAGQEFAAQAKQALENIKQILLAAGYSLEQVVAVDVYVTDMQNFKQFNEIYQTYFTTHKPARAVVEVRGLPKAACVEIKCMASSL